MSIFQNKRLFSFFGGILLSLAILGQEGVEIERSVNKVILEGKVYYIHMVESGQTLYAIARTYGISQKEIAVENPGVISGLQMGQALKIPVEPSMAEGSEQPPPTKGGKTHKVKRGETMYSIARIYGLSEQEFKDANSFVRPEDLKPGQRLLVPEPEEIISAEQGPSYNEEGFIYYKVKRKDTMYSIAREYGVSVQDIRAANPELGWGGPKAGQVIRIPLPQIVDQPEFPEDSPGADTSFSDGDAEAYYYEELMASHDNQRRTYHVAFFIPFAFEEPEPLDSLIKDVKSASRRNRIIERFRMEEKEPQSVSFIEFFQGAMLALDSLRQTGMRLDIRFYDTERSMSKTRELLDLPGMDDMDLFIGPFYHFNLELVSEFAKKEKIPLLTPFYNEMTYVWDNPYLFQASPCMEDNYREMAKIVASKHEYNIVYVREEDSLDVEKHAFLKALIYDRFDDYRPEEPVVFKEMVLTIDHTDEIIHSLSADRRNLVVVPTRNEALASRVVSALYYRLNDFDIEVLGTPYWTEFSSIDYRYYHALGLMFCNPFWLDYLDEDTDRFLRRYRELFYSEPLAMSRKGINYGIAGFDMTMYFVNALKVYGPRFILSLDEYQPRMVLDPYSFSRVSSSGGYVNRQLSFYRFHPDMSIRAYSVPDPPERNIFYRPLEEEGSYFMLKPDRRRR